MKISYYPGCTLKNQARNFEDSIHYTMSHLGVEVEEIERWNCCGTVLSLAADDLMRQIAPVRNLIRAKEADSSRLMTACAMCYNTLKRANERVRNNPTDRDRMNTFMYDEKVDYQGDVDVVHMIEVLREMTGGLKALKTKVVKPLKNLKVASYYGCMMVRPKHVAFDNPETPVLLDEIVAALGGTAIDFSHKTECCGAYQTVDRPEIVGDRTYEIINAARDHGAEIIAVSCPLCAFNLDHRQQTTLKIHPDFHTMPVVYFTQLMAIAFGCDEQTLRLDLHHIPPGPLLAARGLI